MSHLRLLSTDFDGTLIEHFSDGRCTPEFAEVLLQHKKQGGVWAVNTGRGLVHAMEGVEKFQAPVQPDFLLTNESGAAIIQDNSDRSSKHILMPMN